MSSLPPSTPDPSEQDSYSLEEMMKRLRERGHQEGELLTRDDGSQVIRVKKRKRRSHQPHKEEAKRRQRQKVLRIGVAFMILSTIAVASVLTLLYYNSNAFREGLRIKIASWCAAEVELSAINISPESGAISKMVMTWPEGNYLRRLQVDGILARIDPSSFFTGIWGGSSVESQQATLMLAPPVTGKSKRGGLIASNTAFPFSFSNYRCSKLTVKAADINQSIFLNVSDTEATLTKSASGCDLRLVGGRVNVAGLDALKLDRASMMITEENVKVDVFRLQYADDDNGYISLADTVELYEPQSAQMSVELSELQTSALFGTYVGDWISGAISSPRNRDGSYLKFSMSQMQNYEFLADFEGSEKHPIKLSKLPFLDELSRELKSQDFSNFVFQKKASGQFFRNFHGFEIRNLRLEERGLWAVTGSLSVKDDQLTGVLMVGIASDVLLRPGTTRAMQSLFVESRDGYRWHEVKVNGTAQTPKDSFAQALKTAVTDLNPSLRDETNPKKGLQQELDELIK